MNITTSVVVAASMPVLRALVSEGCGIKMYLTFGYLAHCPAIAMLSNCAHFIMSNSTFSWWGAFLGDHPDKKVYVPKYWTHRNHQSLFALPEWTIIDNRNL